MKTLAILVKDAHPTQSQWACGLCFSVLQTQDKFCWNCGAEFEGNNTIAQSYEELRKYNELQKLQEPTV